MENMEKPPKSTFSYNLPSDLGEWVRSTAEEREQSASSFLAYILKRAKAEASQGGSNGL